MLTRIVVGNLYNNGINYRFKGFFVNDGYVNDFDVDIEYSRLTMQFAYLLSLYNEYGSNGIQYGTSTASRGINSDLNNGIWGFINNKNTSEIAKKLMSGVIIGGGEYGMESLAKANYFLYALMASRNINVTKSVQSEGNEKTINIKATFAEKYDEDYEPRERGNKAKIIYKLNGNIVAEENVSQTFNRSSAFHTYTKQRKIIMKDGKLEIYDEDNHLINGNIYLNSGAVDNEVTVEIQQEVLYAYADYSILAAPGGYVTQNLLRINEAERYSKTITKSASETVVYTPEGGLSIQKYISQVNNDYLNDSRKDKNTMLNYEALEDHYDMDDRDIVSGIPQGKISEDDTLREDEIDINDELMPSDNKALNPVKVKPGDVITYTIIVYNNSGDERNDVPIIDIYCSDILEPIKNTDGKVTTPYISKPDVLQQINAGYDRIEWKITKIEPHDHVEFKIQLKVKGYNPNKEFDNMVFIEGEKYDRENNNYRLIDSDVAYMEPIDIQLEKYVSKINDKEISDTEQENEKAKNVRADKQIYNYKIFYNGMGYEKLTQDNVTFEMTKDGKTTINALGIKKLTLTQNSRYTYSEDDLEEHIYGHKYDLSDGQKRTFTSLYGDMDLNDEITAVDARVLLRMLKEYEIPDEEDLFNVRDESNKERISIKDPIKVLAQSADLIDDDNKKQNIMEGSLFLERGDYTVSGEKNDGTTFIFQIGIDYYCTDETKDENCSTSDSTTNHKYSNPVEVKEIGDKIEYTIKLTNNSNTDVIVEKIYDYIPNELTFQEAKCDYGTGQYNANEHTIEFFAPNGTTPDPIELGAWESKNITLICKLEKEPSDNYYIENSAAVYMIKVGYLEFDDGTPQNNSDSDWIMKFLKKDVSLQKYIVKVKSTDNSTNNITGRENKQANSETESKIYYDHNTRMPKTSDSNPFAYKEDNPVEIHQGDEVTYKITVYNNKEYKVKDIQIFDTLPTPSKLISVKDKDGKDMPYEMVSPLLKMTIDNLAGKEAKDIYITVKFPEIILTNNENLAVVTAEYHETEYRALDSDFVKMITADVSLQKYIVKVSNTDNSTDITGRENRKAKNGTKDPIYKNSSGNDVNSGGAYKIDEKVPVNVDDRVTYKITVYNNGISTANNVSVTDTLPTGIKANSESVTDINGQNMSYAHGGTNQIIIPIGTLGVGTFKDIFVTVEFGVFDDTKLDQITNTAKVTADYNVSTYRQEDSDYVKMVTVDMSLQKYIDNLNDGSDHAIRGRENRKAVGSTKDPIYKGSNGNDVNSSGTNKHDDPVYIDPGNIIKYNVIVYNNSNVKATNIKVKDTMPQEVKAYSTDGIHYTNISGGQEIELPIIPLLRANSQTTITVYVKFADSLQGDVSNPPGLSENRAKITDADQHIGEKYRIEDSDYVKKAIYAVSLEKYITKVDAPEGSYRGVNTAKNYGIGRKGKAEHAYDNNPSTNNYIKKDETKTNPAQGEGPVPVNSGNKVTYQILIKNDGNVPVYITKINDVMDAGIENRTDKTTKILTDLKDNAIPPQSSLEMSITLNVTAYQVTAGILENHAEIGEMQNQYKKVVQDLTQNDNADSDYIKLAGLSFSGNVWEDTANNKGEGGRPNGVLDDADKRKNGIKVYLLQSKDGKTFLDKEYASTTTDGNGWYGFENVPHSYKNGDGSYGYYYYMVKFEYDGVTYTHSGIYNESTKLYKSSSIKASNYKVNSNAEEGSTERNNFNNKFAEIKSDGAYNTNGSKTGNITYYTINKKGFDPMSIHENADFMNIKSQTEVINLERDYRVPNKDLDPLKYVNLGLRGRDIFDLNIDNNIDKIDVKVNGVTGEYTYSSKGISIRQSDLYMTDDPSNMNGTEQEADAGGEDNQNVRGTDTQALTEIEITYKINITNESQTDGYATKIKDHYDSKLKYDRCYDSDGNKPTASNDGDNHIVTITMPDKMLSQSTSTSVYVVYKVNLDATNALGRNVNDVTKYYNMAEIESYKTQRADGQTEFTRGLIDYDSAPGSANKEQVRTTENVGRDDLPTVGGNPTTKGYYFGSSNDLTKLKLEDDTDVRGLKITITGDKRKIVGTVYEDSTKKEENRRFGDGKLGKKYDENNTLTEEDENKIGEIQVELIPQGSSKQKPISVTTKEDGSYEFSGFLPGDYIIKYTYGGEGNPIYYNGQAYQSTIQDEFNGKVGELRNADTFNSQNAEDYWYLVSESEGGYSVATDDAVQRETVTNAWKELDGEKTAVFDYIKDNKSIDKIEEELTSKIKERIAPTKTEEEIKNDIRKIIKDIKDNYMFANSREMKIELEKPGLNDSKVELAHDYNPAHEIGNTNFGIALRPKDILETEIIVSEVTLDASDGTQLILAKYEGEGEDKGLKVKKGNMIDATKVTGNNPNGEYSFEISQDLLHGAQLKITYAIIVTNNSETNYKNYIYHPDGVEDNVRISEMRSFVDDKLIFDSSLTANKEWELQESKGKKSKNDIKTTAGNDINKEDIIKEGNEATSYVLTQILTSDDDVDYVFNAATEIMKMISYNGRVPENSILDDGWKYAELEDEDTVGSNVGIIFLAQEEDDTDASPVIKLNPPTGENQNYISIIIIAITSLTVVVVGILGIKKFIKRKDE